MAKADRVYFMPGWRAARGCRIEHLCCLQYGIQTVNLDEEQPSAKEHEKAMENK
jgi:hypothetical protein